MAKWLIIGVVLIAMPGIIFGLVRDVVMIFWSSLPWGFQLIIVAIVVLVALAILRRAWWALTGRSTLHRRY